MIKLQYTFEELQLIAKEFESKAKLISEIKYKESSKTFKLLEYDKCDYIIIYDDKYCTGILKIE